MSVANLARLPQTRPRNATVSASASRQTCQGAIGAAQAAVPPPAPPSPRCPGRRARPACPPRRRTRPARRGGAVRARRCRWPMNGNAQIAHFRPNVVGSACCRWVRPAITVPRWRSRLGGQGAQHRPHLGADQRQALAHLQHGRGVHDVLRRGAPMGPARRPRPRRATARRPGPTTGIADIARAGGQFGRDRGSRSARLRRSRRRRRPG